MVAVKEITETAQAQANTAYRAGQSAVMSGFRSIRDNVWEPIDNNVAVTDTFNRVVDYISPVVEPVVKPIATTATSAFDALPFDTLPTPQEITAGTFDFAEKALASQRDLAERIAEFMNPAPAPAPAKKATAKKTAPKKTAQKTTAKATAKKAAPKKTTAKKTTAKKTTAKKATAKK